MRARGGAAPRRGPLFGIGLRLPLLSSGPASLFIRIVPSPRLKYVEERLSTKRQVAAADAALAAERAATEAGLSRREAALYETPAELQIRKPEVDESSDRWLTGLTEVEVRRKGKGFREGGMCGPAE